MPDDVCKYLLSMGFRRSNPVFGLAGRQRKFWKKCNALAEKTEMSIIRDLSQPAWLADTRFSRPFRTVCVRLDDGRVDELDSKA